MTELDQYNELSAYQSTGGGLPGNGSGCVPEPPLAGWDISHRSLHQFNCRGNSLTCETN